MKFSSFITIALLALIAYALLRPAPSPNAMQEILRLAQQLIPPAPPARTGGPDSQPIYEQPPNNGAQAFPPGTQHPDLTPPGKSSHERPAAPAGPVDLESIGPEGRR